MNRGYDWTQENAATSGTPTNGVPTNKWEAVLTLNQTLASGVYTIQVLTPIPGGQSGVEDSAGNPFSGFNGFTPNGQNGSVTFHIANSQTQNTNQQLSSIPDGSTPYPDTLRAVAASPNGTSPDGDYVVTWTAPEDGYDHVYFQMFNPSGVAADMPLYATSEVQEIQFASQPTSGSWSFSFGAGQTGTPSLRYKISASQLQTQLNDLAASTGQDGTVQVVQGANSWTYFVVFQGGWANESVPSVPLLTQARIRPMCNLRSRR